MSRHHGKARAVGVALIVATALSGALQGCVGAGIVGGALATTGLGVAQERSTRQALTDTEIRVTINNKLLSEDYGLFGDISTEVVEGRVLLAGSVPTQDDRLRAARLVWDTPDVRELINEVTVEGDQGIGSYGRDVWISTQLRAALVADGKVRSINYNVETVGQVVHLIGVARTETELQRVVSHAQRITGVKQVVSHVLTRYDQRRAAS